jgi:chemotaxis protein methyltransferase CheR
VPAAGRYRHVVFPAGMRPRPKLLNVGAHDRDRRPSPEPLPSLSAENTELLEWLFGQAGLNVHRYRTETLIRRVPACLRALRARSPAEARRLLEQDRALVSTALDAMLVGVTWFFRDSVVFETLRDLVLPSLMEGRKNLHAWSAGCSDGAEAYSLALLIAEMGLLPGTYLLGTDCRAEAIRRCRAGCFDDEAVKWVPAGLLERYFRPRDTGWEVVPPIRKAMRWRTADVLTAPEPGVWDLILCRNTAMYFRNEAMSRLWEQFEILLRPGGVLVLGKAERPVGARRLSFLAPCVYRRTRG